MFDPSLFRSSVLSATIATAMLCGLTEPSHAAEMPEHAQDRIPLTFTIGNQAGTGKARPNYVTSDGTATHTTTAGTPVFGVNHDGVADLIISRPGGNARCTGSLLSDGQTLLTAAHCLTDNNGDPVASSVSATWELASGDVIQSSADVTIHPMYNGDLTDGYDIAIVQFDTKINADVPRYDIYRKTNEGEIGVETVKVGYGRGGFGNTGSTTASGTKRFGKNKYEDDGLGTGGTGISNVGGITNSDTQLTYDFDSNFRNLDNLSGNDSDHDAFQFFFNRPEDLGYGDDEVGAAPGDSGGPS
ncbi:MAG: trypsin-like serine protease, partial [Phycisphaeraceae bacterium]